MAQYPALPLFTDAYMADTRHLTAAQHGGYLLLLMTAWRMPDCKLPDDDRFLARCAAMDLRTWLNNKQAISAFWQKDSEQKWFQARLLDERKYVGDKRSKNSAAGKASALKRLNRDSTDVATKPQPNSNPHTHTHKEKDISNDISKKPDLDAERFEKEFWPQYPKQRAGSKDKALHRYREALKRATHDEIMIGVMAYAQSDEVAARFAKGAAAWLHDDRWTNDYTTKGVSRNAGQSNQNGQHHAGGFITKTDRAKAAILRGLADSNADRRYSGQRGDGGDDLGLLSNP